MHPFCSRIMPLVATVASSSTNGIAKVQGIGQQDHVGINGEHERTDCRIDTGVECIGLASVPLGNDPQPAVMATRIRDANPLKRQPAGSLVWNRDQIERALQQSSVSSFDPSSTTMTSKLG